MLEEILNIKTSEDFGNVSAKLLKPESWECLQNECCDEGVILYSVDAWGADVVSRLSSKPEFVPGVVEATKDDTRCEKLFHWLQIISACNPGLRTAINKFVKRAAL